MKTPPLLLGAGLLFWGWQTGHLIESGVMAVILESARTLKVRWDFTDQDFRRIWTFCALLLVAAALFAFADTGGPNDLAGFLQNPNLSNQRNVGNASARTVSALIRWLPMIFFLFVAAQAFSSREGIPAETISVILRLRWQKARKLGRPLPASRTVNVTYPYFVLCLFAASFHSSADDTFYWGLCALTAWALWPLRSRRYGVATWAAAFGLAMMLGYSGQRGVWRAYRMLENYNVQWLARGSAGRADPLMTKTSLGRIGWMKGSRRIVIRLEPKDGSRAPTLLREASYCTWKGQAWYSDVVQDKFETVANRPDQTTWPLLPAKTNIAKVNIACYLPGGVALLPLPPGCGTLENLSAYLVQKSDLGAVLAQGPGLVLFDALYGPGATIDGPPKEDLDTFVPERETRALDRVIDELQLRGRSRRQVLHTLSGYFQQEGKFHYSAWSGWHGFRGTNETPVGRFLLRTHTGHCEYFATATVLLLRRLGIPARYAVGYAVHEASGRQFVVRQSDAHAWCLVWNPANSTWQEFDTTPASWIPEEAKRASPMQFLSDAWSRVTFEIAKFRWGQTHLRRYLLWSLVPVLALLLYQILFRSRRKRQRLEEQAKAFRILWPGLDSEFYQVAKKLSARGAPRQLGEPLSTWLERASADPKLSDLHPRLRALLDLHYRYRFDPDGLNSADREALRREAAACLASIS